MPPDQNTDVIHREVAAAALPFTGERMTSAISGQVMVEHYHRYLLARDHCHGRDVLDIASGEGYGTALLSQVARSAIGVEIDPMTVAAAQREFARPGLGFVAGDARAIPLPDASVDVVVSFETLEHFDGQERFLDECRRVLRPEGLLIISTPDRNIYSKPGTPPNPFHVKELDRPEFEALLRSRYRNVAIAAQRPLIGSAILSTGQGLTTRIFDTRAGGRIGASAQLPQAPYLIAFASDAALPPPVASLYILRDDLDTDPMVRAAAETRAAAAESRLIQAGTRAAETESLAAAAEMRAAAAESRLIQAGTRTAEAESLAAAAETRAAAAESRLAQAGTRVAEAESLAAAATAQLQAYQASEAGRAIRRIQSAARRWPRGARWARRVILLLWWTATLQLPARLRAWWQARRRQTEARGPDRLAAVRRDLGMAEPGTQPPVEPADIVLPPAGGEPLVSVIIPTYGQLGYTLRCLRSIAMAPPRAAIEVIVAEDASGDPGIARLREVHGILFRENSTNLGFLRSCNAAARTARGRYLLFLNNDTEVLPGAIDALADLAAARPDAGLVGARLVYPDGRLQEAGGIVWQDASAWNYGNGEDPRRPEFNYLRQVDYCSGAAILLRRDLFEQLGGFDEYFVPAYYEDTDLAFRIRALGLKVYYQPRALVVHHEGISHGTDIRSGVKAQQVTNQARFAARWGSLLQAKHLPNGTQVLRARDRAGDRPVVLVIDHKVLEPDRDAGSRSTFEHIRTLLREGWAVKFRPHNGFPTPGYLEALQDLGVEVLHGPWVTDLAAWLEANGASIDVALLNRPEVAAASIPAIRRLSKARIVFYGHDLHFARLRREAALSGSAETTAEAERMLLTERLVWRQCDTVLYPSAEEAAEVRALEPEVDARAVTPYCFDAFPRRTAPPAPAGGILFVAGFAHPPNVDAALWLVQDVLPLIRKHLPGVPLTLAGSNPTSAVQALRAAGVTVTGALSAEELAARYAAARVAVVPLRFGAGVKLKVVEALQQGLPLVTTPVGAQGLPLLHDILPVTDDAATFAAGVVRLATEDEAWLQQSAAQSDYAERHFSEAALRDSLLSAIGLTATGRSWLP